MAVTRNVFSGLYSAHCDGPGCAVELVSHVGVTKPGDPHRAQLEVMEMVEARGGNIFGRLVFCSRECREKCPYVTEGKV